MHDHAAALKELGGPTRELREHIPDAWSGFVQLAQSAVADGAIPGRVKEAFAVAMAVVDGCDNCISHRARAAAQRGTSEQEMAEALGVALLMKGRPASTMAPVAWSAFQGFRAREDVC